MYFRLLLVFICYSFYTTPLMAQCGNDFTNWLDQQVQAVDSIAATVDSYKEADRLINNIVRGVVQEYLDPSKVGDFATTYDGSVGRSYRNEDKSRLLAATTSIIQTADSLYEVYAVFEYPYIESKLKEMMRHFKALQRSKLRSRSATVGC